MKTGGMQTTVIHSAARDMFIFLFLSPIVNADDADDTITH
jgi:hypothetical protein